eukprot:2216252-Pyramimonas_sp.AAC.1
MHKAYPDVGRTLLLRADGLSAELPHADEHLDGAVPRGTPMAASVESSQPPRTPLAVVHSRQKSSSPFLCRACGLTRTPGQCYEAVFVLFMCDNGGSVLPSPIPRLTPSALLTQLLFLIIYAFIDKLSYRVCSLANVIEVPDSRVPSHQQRDATPPHVPPLLANSTSQRGAAPCAH